MKVLALTKYGPLGASSRVRTFQYVPFLKEQGIDVSIHSLLPDEYLQRFYNNRSARIATVAAAYVSRLRAPLQARSYELLWLEKELAPFLPGWLERGLLAGQRYVLDYDDAIFHRYDLHPNPLVRRAMGQKIDRVMRGAAVVTAGNEYLAERAERAGARRVEIIPSVIDASLFGAMLPEPKGPFTIGWIGSPTSERQLEPIRRVLQKQIVEHGSRVVLVGATPNALVGLNVERRSWSEATEVNDIRSFHVGIMPLTDTPWRRGKCGFKLIQCMAAGRPVIASPVGVNTEIVRLSQSGFLASGLDEWNMAFQALRVAPELRRAMGQAGHEAVAQRYSVQSTAPRLGRLMHEMIK